jgi:hypothetical protein
MVSLASTAWTGGSLRLSVFTHITSCGFTRLIARYHGCLRSVIGRPLAFSHWIACAAVIWSYW